MLVENRIDESVGVGPLEGLYRILPSEMMRECFSFLDSVEIMFGIGFVCKSWRKNYAWPIISDHIKPWMILDNSNCVVNSFDELFVKQFGRNCLRFMMRRFMFDMAREISRKQLRKERKFILDNNSMSEMVKVLEWYFSKFKSPPSIYAKSTYQRSEVFGHELFDPIVKRMKEMFRSEER